MSFTYEEYERACKDAATRQGLDPIVERLTAEGIDTFVEQTGGYTMVVRTANGKWGLIFDDGQYNIGEYNVAGEESGPYLSGTLDDCVAVIRRGTVVSP